MESSPPSIQQYRTLFLRGSPANLAALIERIGETGAPQWRRNQEEENATRAMQARSWVGYCFECDESSSHTAAVVWVSGDQAGELKVVVYPAFNVYDSLSIDSYNAVITAFEERFRPLVQEFADCQLFEPAEVTIADYVGQTAAEAFHSFTGDYTRYRRDSLSDSHQSVKWVKFVCLAYQANARANLSASQLANLLLAAGFPQAYARELGTQWERSAEVLDEYTSLESQPADS